MGIFSFFKEKPEPTAAAAKERLQVVIAHQRGDRKSGSGAGPDYLPKLKEEILAVIRKYQSIDEKDVSVQLDKQDDCDVLELNITLSQG